MIFLEFDLAGAEWVVVAYLANDANMIGVVKSGKSPHVVTGALISSASEELVKAEHEIVGSATDQDIIAELRKQLPELLDLEEKDAIFLPRSMSIRQAGKKSNHGLNYGMKFRRFALENEVPESDAKPLVDAYSSVAYPGLKDYWNDIRLQIKKEDRTLTNCFGRKVRLLGEFGEQLLMDAYSFKPQSTVVDSVNKAMCLVYEDEDPLARPMELGAEVHDSLMLQYPIPAHREEWLDIARFAQRVGLDYMRPELSYNGHTFRLGCDLKMGVNWGDMHSVKITENTSELADAMHDAYASSVRVGQLQEVLVASVEAGQAPYLGR